MSLNNDIMALGHGKNIAQEFLFLSDIFFRYARLNGNLMGIDVY